MSDLAASNGVGHGVRRSPLVRVWTRGHARVRAFAAHPDPLAEAGNWVALTVGSHLPFWPLYVLGIAGPEAWPSSLLTVAMAPFFLAVPLIARRSSRIGRVATPLLGIINTIFTMWVLGNNSGTEIFFAPCAALAALVFRQNERLLMLGLTMLPLVAWYILQHHPLVPLHQYEISIARELQILNVCSVGILIVLFGWFQVDIYRKMEKL